MGNAVEGLRRMEGQAKLGLRTIARMKAAITHAYTQQHMSTLRENM
jgi:hypothetical protein